jgi:hypothetical protein
LATTKKSSSARKTVKGAMRSAGKTTKRLGSKAGKARKSAAKAKGRKSTRKRVAAKR